MSLGRQKRWDTCAVVGSSGQLLGHECGADIDRAEAVFRINKQIGPGLERRKQGSA